MLVKLIIVLLAFHTLILSAYADLPHHERDLGSITSYIELPFQKHEVRTPLRKRHTNVPIIAEGLGWAYLVNVTIGSNNQTVLLCFDTGSENTWVNPDCSTIENEIWRASCLSKPRYNPLTSTTAKILDASFNFTYGSGSVLGTYFTDDINIGGALAKNTHFGVASASLFEGNTGILGTRKAKIPTLSMIGTLAVQGQINSYAYSVNLRSINETGAVILGGIDTKKYQGGLTKVHAKDALNPYMTDLGITLPNKTSITIDRSIWRGNDTRGLPVMLDTGTPTNLLPPEIYFTIPMIYPDVTSHMSPWGYPIYNVPCDAPLGTFDYSFGNLTIKVPFRDSLYQYSENNCTFGFTIHPGHSLSFTVPFILGDTFLRGTYLVVDVDNNELWMGESTDCGSNIVPIGKGKDAVPVVPGCGCEVEPGSSVS